MPWRGTFGLVLFAVTAIGVVASPLLVLVVAPGFVSDGGDFDLAALMLRFTFPYLFFISLTGFCRRHPEYLWQIPAYPLLRRSSSMSC